MMQRVAALPMIEIRARANAPMMEQVVQADVPDIAQHQARGDPAGEIEASSPPQWKQSTDDDPAPDLAAGRGCRGCRPRGPTAITIGHTTKPASYLLPSYLLQA